ncbi:DNA glycosylase [Methanonatronarchaeum sp. AMET-Sl]|uniref:DNA glycosylase n=1 Tax=Methanonatronarchaeum sp. AMET-Sl TaxID=3037654 RepID=UPI00244E3546|nr:DNA glycosylase [Methanonatronarchaeum sp. AMET-Sl]WGI16650.1 DNA glycosylase [Methanonatronarchaeum sp. AMET-Sl]
MKTRTIKPKKPFNLKYTLYSGQPPNFIFNKKDNSHYGYIKHNSKYKPIRLKQKQTELEIKTKIPKTKVKKFLGINHDLNHIYSQINTDKKIQKQIDNFNGLRITKSDPQFSIISFIVSANNCIRNITSFITNLTEQYGEKTEIDGYQINLPPEDKVLFKLSEEDFKKLKAGYRSKYLEKTLEMIKNKQVDLNSLHHKKHTEVKEKLMDLMGVGTKISDCISLFSYSNYEAFPIDVNIRRSMKKNYNLKQHSDKEIQIFAKNKWGEYAGYAQQYIYLDALTTP